MEIFKREFDEYVVFCAIAKDADLDISRFELLETGTCFLQPGCVYLCDPLTLPSQDVLAAGANLIYVGGLDDKGLAAFMARDDLNLLLLSEIALATVVNRIAQLFTAFMTTSNTFYALLAQGRPLGDLLDVLSDFSGMPLVFMDLYQDNISMSSRNQARNNPFWESMCHDDEWMRHEILANSTEKVASAPCVSGDVSVREMVAAQHPVLEGSLHVEGQLTATLWGFAPDARQRAFKPDDRQVFSWMCALMATWARTLEPAQRAKKGGGGRPSAFSSNSSMAGTLRAPKSSKSRSRQTSPSPLRGSAS
jgi:hypothetical protein